MATLTLRNVPDDLVARLKERAKRHRRSLNSETIASLELADAAAEGAATAPLPLALDREPALARIREIQARFPGAAQAVTQPRDPEELRAELELFARLRSHFKGPPLSSDEVIEAIGREQHPAEQRPA
jgi:plasmid stability protein